MGWRQNEPRLSQLVLFAHQVDKEPLRRYVALGEGECIDQQSVEGHMQFSDVRRVSFN